MFNFGSYFSYDSLTIYDGGSMSSDLVGKFCGNTPPPNKIIRLGQVRPMTKITFPIPAEYKIGKSLESKRNWYKRK